MSIQRYLLLPLLTVLLWLDPGSPAPTTQTHELEVIKNNPGLYYERISTVRFKRTIWQVVIFIEVESFLQAHGPVLSFKETEKKCRVLLSEGDCSFALGTELIELRHTQLEAMHSQIKEILETIGTYKPDPTSELPSVRRKRMAPLGIIGSISKSLFGLVTSDDVDTINKNIDQLFNDQGSMVKLVEEQSHIVEAKLEELRNVTQAHEVHIQRLEEVIQKHLNRLQKDEERTQFTLRLMTYSRRVEAKINHLISSAQSLIDVLVCLKQGKIHQSLLNQKMLHQFRHDINRVTGDLDLPMPVEHLRPEGISAISSVDGIRKDGRIFAILNIPLVDKAVYHLYKLHPVGIPQTIINSSDSMAYIQPSYPYLSISTDHQTYVKMSSESWERCQMTPHGRICPTEQPLQDITEKTECEVDMLLHPSPQGLTSCDVHLQAKAVTQWTYLTSEETWLFSAAKPTRVRVICPGKPTQELKLKGLGLLRLASNCIGRTDTITLMHDQTKRDGLYYLYQPEVHLRLSEAIPKFKEHQEFLVEVRNNPVLTPDSWSKKGEPLSRILGKMREISSHKRETGQAQSLLYGGLAGYLVIAVVTIIIIVTRCKRRSQGSWSNAERRKPTYNVKRTDFSAVNPESALELAPIPGKPPRNPSSTGALPKQINEVDE